MLSPIIPPFRYATVEDKIYRGAYPKDRNYRFLKRLKLKTILSLIPEQPIPDLLEFCRSQNIRNMHLQVGRFKDNVTLNGANVTGLVIACLRKLQMWSVSSAMGEFLRYLRGGVISGEESEFIEKFSAEIEIPRTIPSWLWGGHVTFAKHPTLKLKFLDPTMIEQPEQKQSKKKKGVESIDDKNDFRKRDDANANEDEEAEVSMTLQALALEGLNIKNR
nr:8929_t:CDS:2 [Entrophospora candida]